MAVLLPVNVFKSDAIQIILKNKAVFALLLWYFGYFLFLF